MKDQTLTPIVIFSMHAKPADLPACLKVRACEGCYKGECEPAFIAQAADFYAAGMPALLYADGQESILYLDNQRNGWLRYGPGFGESDAVFIGRWREISKVEASYLTAYTRLGERYFAAY